MTQEEFIKVIHANRKLIYKVCRIYCPDAEKRKDLEQEILLQLWVSIDRYDGRAKLSTWIYRVALNTAIAFYRKDSRRPSFPEIDSAIIATSDDEHDGHHNEKIAFLHHLIQQLNINERALMLLYLDNVSHGEIADILGLSTSNVATKIFRIKNAIKEKMIDHFKP